MNLWERFLRTIYRAASQPFLKQYQGKSIEVVLKRSTSIIDTETQVEVRNFILKSLSEEGGFVDKAGKVDVYYSLFGCLAAEALGVKEVFAPLKDYIKRIVSENNLTGIHLYCGAILYSKLHGFDSTTEKLRLKVEEEVKSNRIGNSNYNDFIGILALYYLQDYRNLLKLRKQIAKGRNTNELPCSMVAANGVACKIIGKTTVDVEKQLRSYYRSRGGFVALQKAPVEDLLSTAVILFALNFIDSDLRDIKPECLTYIDGLYLNGGFRATELDFDIDIEYTFYGLLALGALSE